MLAAWASEHGVELPDLAVARPTLEDVYLETHSHRKDGHPMIAGQDAARALALVRHQFRYDLRSFSRNRQARVTTLIFPVMLLVILWA